MISTIFFATIKFDILDFLYPESSLLKLFNNSSFAKNASLNFCFFDSSRISSLISTISSISFTPSNTSLPRSITEYKTRLVFERAFTTFFAPNSIFFAILTSSSLDSKLTPPISLKYCLTGSPTISLFSDKALGFFILADFVILIPFSLK